MCSSCGPWRGVTVITAVSRAGLSAGAATSTTSRSAESRVGEPLQRLVGRAAGQRDGDDQRPVDAGAEALGEAVVGLALRGVGGEVAVVGLAELQAGRRRGERDDDGAGGDQREHRALGRPRRARACAAAAARSRRARAAAAAAVPARAKRAGSRTTQTIAQASTTSPAATPARPTNGMPVTSRPEIETSTMPAAVRAEWPAVALARRAASTGEWPARSSSCWRAASSSA